MHIPVLLKETIELLNLHSGDNVVDGTVGLGGHAKVVLEKILPGGRLLAMDRDPRQIILAKQNLSSFKDQLVFVSDSYSNLAKHLYDQRITPIVAVLLDLGYSSVHVDDPARGFSFQTEGPLDMRYNQILPPFHTGGGAGGELTADTIINSWSEEELARIFLVLGEEKNAKKIARAIIKKRKEKKIASTTELATLIEKVVPRYGKVHPATKVFQALRITVNDELGELERALPQIMDVLKPGGRLAVISFHSLEDRVVKTFFKKQNNKILKIINKHVIVPSEEETRQNPRSRSAKLRVAEKI